MSVAEPQDHSIPPSPSARLQALVAAAADEITFDDLVRALGGSAPGFLLLGLAAASFIPTGLPVAVPLGGAMMAIGVLMALGRREIPLPSWLARRTLTRTQLAALVGRVVPFMRPIERLLIPRLLWMLGSGWLRLAGIAVAINGFLILMPIPFGNTAPAFAVLIVSLGLMLSDGAAVLAGLLASVAALIISVGIIVIFFEIVKTLLF